MEMCLRRAAGWSDFGKTGRNPTRRIIMLKNTWVKWSLLVAGSTILSAGIGACISQFLLQSFILNAVN
jgi:hypothetical protein